LVEQVILVEASKNAFDDVAIPHRYSALKTFKRTTAINMAVITPNLRLGFRVFFFPLLKEIHESPENLLHDSADDLGPIRIFDDGQYRVLSFAER